MYSLIHLSSAIALLANPLFTSSATVTARICESYANGYELIDDAPSINKAIEECGPGSTIVLRDPFYSIRSPINLSNCHDCAFEIEGTLVIARGQWDYWRSVDSVFTISNTTRLHMHSVTGNGVIDGNAI